MIPQPHATLQEEVSWRNQCHDRTTLQGVRIPATLLSRRSRQRERLSASVVSICLFVCLSVCRRNAKKRDFFQKPSNLELWSLLTTYIGSRTWALQEPIVGPLKSKMAEIRHPGCWRQNAKTRFFVKLSNLVSCNLAFQRTHYWIPKIPDGWDPPSWKSTWSHFFLPRVVRFG